MNNTAIDLETAEAFATSWNNLPEGSVYTRDQVEDWFAPLLPKDFQNKRVLELGCGNASLLMHVAAWDPSFIEGVDLGDSVSSARQNMNGSSNPNWTITRADLTTFDKGGYDVVYCIGVLHHLKEPEKGFDAVVRNVRDGGHFHCWVYAKEGNGLVILLVDPIRKMVSKLPWFITKYGVALPLSVPFYLYAKFISLFESNVFENGDSFIGKWISKLPLASYCRWIAKREFKFFWHVAFDQLVTPQTQYITRKDVTEWLASRSEVDLSSTYIIRRNGNSWKFGGIVRRPQ